MWLNWSHKLDSKSELPLIKDHVKNKFLCHQISFYLEVYLMWSLKISTASKKQLQQHIQKLKKESISMLYVGKPCWNYECLEVAVLSFKSLFKRWYEFPGFCVFTSSVHFSLASAAFFPRFIAEGSYNRCTTSIWSPRLSPNLLFASTWGVVFLLLFLTTQCIRYNV